MPLESSNFIDQLNESWPVGNTDFLDNADDHLRNLKVAIKGSFPNLGLQAVTLTAIEINELVGKIADNVTAISSLESTKKNKSDFSFNSGTGRLDITV